MEKFINALFGKPFAFKILDEGKTAEIGIVWVAAFLLLLLSGC